MQKHLIIMVFSLGLSACSLFGRSESSGYADYEDGPSAAQEFYLEKRAHKISSAREELGYQNRSELTEKEAESVYARIELARLEKNLEYDLEKRQYFALKPYFNNDLERIYFLRLPNREARERWANAKGIRPSESQFDAQVVNLIEKNDIAKGMSREAVRQSWGDPDIEEVAGNSLYGNERWKYNKLVSTDEGYKPETRIIYFESARVIGWETLK